MSRRGTDGAGVLCVGRLYCDLIFTDVPRMPTLGTETFAGGLGLHAGGGACITAAWLAALGRPTGLACYLPPSPFARSIVTEIEAAGVDLTLSQPTAPQHAPQLTVSIAKDDDRAFLTHRRGPAFPDLSADDMRQSRVRHVHIGELSTLIERPEILAVAREAGARVSLDCAWEDDIDTGGLGTLLREIDVFFPNEMEAQQLERLGLPLDAPGLTVTKRGAAGASVQSGGTRHDAPAVPVSVVDTTGAGDAFNAGFLHAWMSGEPVTACLRAGTALGARAVSRRGGFACDGPVDAIATAVAP